MCVGGGGGGVLEENNPFYGKGMDIFWNHTMRITTSTEERNNNIIINNIIPLICL